MILRLIYMLGLLTIKGETCGMWISGSGGLCLGDRGRCNSLLWLREPTFSLERFSLSPGRVSVSTLRGGSDSGIYDSIPGDEPMTPREVTRGGGSSYYSDGIYSLSTSRHSHVSYYGFMFNIRAKAYPIVITGLR
jgi:hypothetical protein